MFSPGPLALAGRGRPVWRAWAFFILCGVFGALSYSAMAGTASGGTAPAAGAPTAADRVAQLHSERVPTTPGQRLVSLLGLFAFVGVCVLMSDNRSKINWRLVAWGMALQLGFGILVLMTKPGMAFFSWLNDATLELLKFTDKGSEFLFRSFVTGQIEAPLVNFTFKVLPTIIFFSSLMTVGYYLGIMQWVVNAFAVVMQKTMRCSGAETLSTAANIFVGQTEAPLVVKPYVKDMTQSELLAVMAGGFANTAGGVLAAYVSILHNSFPDIAGHLIAQSVMSAPAALVCAKIVMPETGKPLTGEHVKMVNEKIDANVLDAASRGASEGLTLAFNVACMLLAFIALIAFANALLTGAAALLRGSPVLTLEGVLGWVGYPIALVMGVPVQDCWAVGKLIGVKTVINEFVAYMQMADLLNKGEPLSYRAVLIASYALSGFANFSSIAIQIGGISAIAPTRRHDLAKLGLKAMIVGSFATFMTASVAGLLAP